jgi:hypothetical protein
LEPFSWSRSRWVFFGSEENAAVEGVGKLNRLHKRLWSPSIFTGDSQHIIFDGLSPGKTYTVQVRALGGSTGQSDWSDPSSHMAM